MANPEQEEQCESNIGAFMKYEKMGEDSGSVGAAALSASSNRYIVTEKVHGANFCLIAKLCSSDPASIDVKFAKRTAILGSADDAEDFYSCRSAGLLRALAPCAERVLRTLMEKLAGAEELQAVHIYGELFGGSYPHPDVAPTPGLQPVQCGVWYSPTLQFMAFDVALEVAARPRQFLDFAAAQTLCERCGLMFARALCEGTLAECLEFPIEFVTTIPERLSLSTLPSGAAGGERNVAEGVVVRPSKEPVQRSAPSSKGAKESGRGLFKRKIEAFSEKKYQNDDWKKGKSGGAGAAPAISEQDLVLIEIQANVTEQRLANVLSKIGRVDAGDKEACRQLLSDFMADVSDSLEPEDDQVLKQSPAIQEQLKELCKEVITQDFKARGLLTKRNVATKAP